MATSYTISVVSTSENEIGGSGGTPAIHSTLARHGDGRTQRQFDTTITKDTKGCESIRQSEYQRTSLLFRFALPISPLERISWSFVSGFEPFFWVVFLGTEVDN